MTIDNEKNPKEQLNRDELFKLYEIALEAMRYYARTSLQLWVASPAVLTLFGMLAFSSRNDLPATGAWLLVSSVGSLFAAVILLVINLYDEAQDISRKVASEIEGRLTGQDSGDISRLFVTSRTRLLFPLEAWGLDTLWQSLWQSLRLLWRRGGITILLLFLVIWWCLWWWVFH